MEISMIDGTMSCEGNWYELKLETPLAEEEEIEWNVYNGMDEEGNKIQSRCIKGKTANRLFIARIDHAHPMLISATIKATCQAVLFDSKNCSKSFATTMPIAVVPNFWTVV